MLTHSYFCTDGGAQTQSFTYDALDRLLTANATGGTGGAYSETYTYWGSGRMDDGPLGSGYTYSNGAHKHAVTAVGSNSFAYDANGNMTAPRGLPTVGGATYNLTYDAEKRLVSVSGAATASFLYAP